jgi:hypothetical protein
MQASKIIAERLAQDALRYEVVVLLQRFSIYADAGYRGVSINDKNLPALKMLLMRASSKAA